MLFWHFGSPSLPLWLRFKWRLNGGWRFSAVGWLRSCRFVRGSSYLCARILIMPCRCSPSLVWCGLPMFSRVSAARRSANLKSHLQRPAPGYFGAKRNRRRGLRGRSVMTAVLKCLLAGIWYRLVRYRVNRFGVDRCQRMRRPLECAGSSALAGIKDSSGYCWTDTAVWFDCTDQPDCR